MNKTKDHLHGMEQMIGGFAEKEIAPAKLYAQDKFPRKLWANMGKQGILGIGIPLKYGGQGGGYEDIAKSGYALVASGHCLGLSVSWMIHIAAARFLVFGLGNKRQKLKLLPAMAKGEITMSLAISEPKTGAHPRHLKTMALAKGGGFILTGEKTYLTNGPIADIFAVVAITGGSGRQKEFSAFLTPKKTPGLVVRKPMSLGFFKPSPHGGITLDKCEVLADSILGQKGQAYHEIIKPFRDTEDILMMGPVCGGMERAGELLTRLIKNSQAGSDEKFSDLGLFLSLTRALFAMAINAAQQLDKDPQSSDLSQISVAFRHIAKHALDSAARIIKGIEPKDDSELIIIIKDLVLSGQIAQKASAIKQKKIGGRALAV